VAHLPKSPGENGSAVCHHRLNGKVLGSGGVCAVDKLEQVKVLLTCSLVVTFTILRRGSRTLGIPANVSLPDPQLDEGVEGVPWGAPCGKPRGTLGAAP
jgi:hypothetical protein